MSFGRPFPYFSWSYQVAMRWQLFVTLIKTKPRKTNKKSNNGNRTTTAAAAAVMAAIEIVAFNYCWVTNLTEFYICWRRHHYTIVVVVTCALFAFSQALLQNLMQEPNEMKTIESICEMIWKIRVVCISVFNIHKKKKKKHTLTFTLLHGYECSIWVYLT